VQKGSAVLKPCARAVAQGFALCGKGTSALAQPFEGCAAFF